MGTEREEAEKIYDEGRDLLRQASDWSEKHKDFLIEVRKKASSSLAVITTTKISENPQLLFFGDACHVLVKDSFQLGCYCGRTYEGVPPVFKEAMEEGT